MDKKLFAELVESMTEAGEIARGERVPAREFRADETDARRIRRASGLSQAKFAELIHVEIGTLRNWEQGRRTNSDRAGAGATPCHRKGSARGASRNCLIQARRQLPGSGHARRADQCRLAVAC